MLKCYTNMGNTRTVQTAFRFSPDLVERLKRRARKEKTSVNAYVEKVLEKDLGTDEDRYEALYREIAKIKINSNPVLEGPMKRLLGCVQFTEEEIAADPRLEYLLKKYGE